jgi:hypothetical protein
MRGAIPPLPQYAFMEWCLVKHRYNFTFTFLTSNNACYVIRSRSHTHNTLCAVPYLSLTLRLLYQLTWQLHRVTLVSQAAPSLFLSHLELEKVTKFPTPSQTDVETPQPTAVCLYPALLHSEMLMWITSDSAIHPITPTQPSPPPRA